ncbi:hypothetical protein K443DRAFT_280882 [Laccaria amethystina LaAM-08-1]|uniref:Uncharacterized protein n=1 Tax=Laccaria amethystina LaAM-08-1 TaxID=1095629 RepID=A0A0C9X5P7_9AGAR|nr:hypothetical protein K443DRAFT_280882 [Laccaria amethystina LaAM-08-1]
MRWLSTALVILATSLVTVSAASGLTQCLAFDVNWNLLAFGYGGKDYNAGTQDSWGTSGSATDITASGRPPFDQPNVQCFLSQFTNAIYVINGDSKNPSTVYIYDATAKSWSAQTTSTTPATSGGPQFDPTNFGAILDHDTNVFYAYSDEELFALDMGLLKSANSTAIPWVDVQKPNFATGQSTDSYQPVMALASNHIHFLGLPGLPAGDAKIFVIHFSFLQPDPQLYGSFPTTHGRAASFFQQTGVQTEFAFIPDDGSATYVVNVITNTTKTLTGPSTKDASATYTASTSALVQLSSSAGVSWMGYDSSAGTGTAWTAVKALPAVNLTSQSSGSGSASAGASSTGSGAVKPSGSAGAGSGGSTSGGVSVRVGGGSWWWSCLVVGVLGVGVGLLV